MARRFLKRDAYTNAVTGIEEYCCVTVEHESTI